MTAVLAVPFLAALPARIVHAQLPVNNGHARDANPQVGSGGYNQASRNGSTVTSNDIVYGNVTGLRGFQGPHSTDPTAFRGRTFTNSADRFIGESNPAAVRGTPSANIGYYTPTPYYSDARGVAPPAGYVPVVGGGGFCAGDVRTKPVNTPTKLLTVPFLPVRGMARLTPIRTPSTPLTAPTPRTAPTSVSGRSIRRTSSLLWSFRRFPASNKGN